MEQQLDTTVLFVDDELRILAAINRMLRRERYRKLFASSAKEALQIIDKEPVHVLVTDLRMPEMDGLALIKEVKKRKPDIVRVVLSGYSQVPTLLAAINEGDVLRYLTKPWNSEEEFKKAIRDAIAYYRRQREEKELVEELRTEIKALRDTLQEYEKRLAECGQQQDLLWHYIHTHIEPPLSKLAVATAEGAELKQRFEELKRLIKP
ncbi:MAG: response regulator [Aquificota bacterium]|nr:MAG: response regulator [Aquificota bacterium]